MDDVLLQFIEQSNLIEGIDDPMMVKDSLEAWRFLAGYPLLTDDVILRTQKLVVQNQNKYFKAEKIKKVLKKKHIGQYRDEQVEIGKWDIVGIDPVNETLTKMWVKTGECMDFNQIKPEMEQWIVNANDVVQNGKEEPIHFLDELIRKHHIRFEKIHPFIDGNGRVGRMLMNWQRIKVGLPLLIIWEDEKSDYYKWFKGDKKDGSTS